MLNSATFLICSQGSDHFDIESTPQRQPDRHVVAVRITAEDANDGFKPTCGRIDELIFRPTPEVGGRWAVCSAGGAMQDAGCVLCAVGCGLWTVGCGLYVSSIFGPRPRWVGCGQ